jgi:flagellar hook-associated protein 2
MSSLFTDQGGLVKEMSNYVNDYTKFGGILDERLERLNTAITAYEAKENRNEEILSKYEESLRKKYSNLDTLMAGYTTSMGYLSNVLSGMNTSS